MASNLSPRRGRRPAQQNPPSATGERTHARTERADAEGESADLAPPRRRDPRIERVLQAIETRFAEPDLSLAKLAREQNLSTWYLCRLLRVHGGVTFRRHLHDARCTEALRLLHGTPLSVKEIAAAVGYGETRRLDQQFGKRYGYPPSHVRRRGRR